MHHETSILYGPVNAIAKELGFSVPDHVIMALLVLLISLILFPLITRRLSRDDPGPMQQSLEVLVQGIKGLLEDIVGHGAGNRYLYIIGAYTVFIFFSNIIGQFYFLQPPTANVNTTFALSISAFLYYNFQGIRQHGPVKYVAHFMGPVLWLAPLFFVIEIIGNFARILSLGMRLFGNITGEHMATGIFMGIFPLLLPLPMQLLGIFGSILQTFVFVMLTMVYIGGAVAAEEH
ncbi:MAG: F0F1 ATP synthase subunit A [Thermoanaerobaculia bacterium]